MIERRSAWRDRLRSYSIEVDGNRVATVRNGGTASVTLDPGPHVVRACIDWTGSRQLTISVEPGRAVTCQVGPARALISGLVSTDRYLDLYAVD